MSRLRNQVKPQPNFDIGIHMADRVDAILQETTTTKYQAFCPN